MINNLIVVIFLYYKLILVAAFKKMGSDIFLQCLAWRYA